MRFRMTLLVLGLALCAGTLIGFVDSRPTWDDTGITAVAVLLSSAVLAATAPRVGLLVGVAVGAPVPIFNAIVSGSLGSVVAVVIGLVGAGIGTLIGRNLRPGATSRPA